MKKYLATLLILTTTSLTIVIAWRLSADALALIAGVALGILAMSPTVLVIMWLTRSTLQARNQQQAPPAYPPIIVAGGAPMNLPQQQPASQQPGLLPPPQAASGPLADQPRQWVMRVYGEE